jgi:hypothetical protein
MTSKVMVVNQKERELIEAIRNSKREELSKVVDGIATSNFARIMDGEVHPKQDKEEQPDAFKIEDKLRSILNSHALTEEEVR